MSFAFVPDLPTMLAYSVACFVLFITPGPDMSLMLARTVTGGPRLGMASMLGTNLGCCIHSAAVALGLSALLTASPAAFGALKLVGAAYLLWLAVDAVRNGSSLNVRADRPAGGSVAAAFWTGVAVNLTNPKVVLFFVAFLPPFVSASDPNAAGKLFFLGLYFVVFNIPLGTLLILAAHRVVGWLKARPAVLRGIDYTFAGVFGFFAFGILTTQR